MKYLLLLLLGCSQAIDATVEPEDIAGLAEEYCMDHPTLPCGKVYQCDTPADNELGFVEICVPQFMDISVAEATYGACKLSTSPRLKDANLCWWCCGEGCGAGCNALTSCYCPE